MNILAYFRKIELIVVILFLSATFHSEMVFARDGSTPSDIEIIREGALLGDNSIMNGKGNVSFVWVRVDSTSARAQELYQQAMDETPPGSTKVIVNNKTIDLYFAFNSPKIRCDENTIDLLPSGQTFHRWWQSAYNGEKMDLLRLDGIGTNGLILPMGSIQANNIIFIDKFDPRYQGMCITGIPIATFLQGTAQEGQLKNLRITGEEMQDGILCKVIEGDVINSDIGYKVWLSPEKMYRPLNVEKRSQTSLIIVHNSLKGYENNLWFPEHVSVKTFYFDTDAKVFVLEEQLFLTVQSDFEINTDVPDSIFEITFPSGLTLYDIRTGLSSVVQ
jgi:hypothetical protein